MNTGRTISLERFLYIVLVVAVIAVIGWFLHLLSAVLMPFFIALVIAYLLDPTVDRVRKLVRNQAVAVMITLALLFGLMIGFVMLIAPQITKEAQRFGSLMAIEFPLWQAQAQQTPWLHDVFARIAAIDPQRYLTEENVLAAARKVLPGFWSGISNVFGWVLGLVGVFTTIIYLLFILIDEEDVKENWEKLIPSGYRRHITGVIGDLQRVMNLWFRGQLKLAMVLTVVYVLGFWMIGLPLALVLGLIAGVLSVIPYLSLLTLPMALFSAGLLALEEQRSIGPIMLLALLVYMVAYALDGMLLTPRIQGKNTGLRPQYILLSLSIWGYLFGITGMIIALPLTTVIISYYERAVLEEAPTEHTS